MLTLFIRFCLIFCIATTIVCANPIIDPNITPQGADVSNNGNTTTINQTAPQAIINWQSFNIGAQEKTHFQQPNQGIALNRINPQQGPSEIFGVLTATGKIILINQSGIYFAPGSYVNVGSLIASTKDISNQNFLAGKYIFDQPSLYQSSIINKGTIIAANHGLIALMSNNIENDGIIHAHLGNVVLASGNKFTINLSGDDLISFTIDEAGAKGNSITQFGKIYANGGKILIAARAAEGIVDNVINMKGVLQAKSVAQHRGEITLLANNGKISVSGKVDVSGSKQGGTTKILGKNINVAPTAKILAMGNTGGGTILIGGNVQGTGTEPHAQTTIIEAGSVINASALSEGNGGKVVVWSDNSTVYAGSVLVKGGEKSGNGGFVEISGKKTLVYSGNVNVAGPKGTNGTVLFDPENLTIQTAGPTTATPSGSPPNQYTSNTDDSILTISDLLNALANGNVIVQTGSSGSQAGDITVANTITWANNNTLTLSAFRNINLYADINNSAGGGLTLLANNTRTQTVGTINYYGGTVNMSGGGQVNYFYSPELFPVLINLSGLVNVSDRTGLTVHQQVNNLTNGFNDGLNPILPYNTEQVKQSETKTAAGVSPKPKEKITIVLNEKAGEAVHSKEISKKITCQNLQGSVCQSLTLE